MGGFFALAGTASINDLFFVHQHGFRVGLWNFAVIVSFNMSPIISGYVIVDLSWKWCFWILAISFGVLLGWIVLFFPETTFQSETTGVDLNTRRPCHPGLCSNWRESTPW